MAARFNDRVIRTGSELLQPCFGRLREVRREALDAVVNQASPIRAGLIATCRLDGDARSGDEQHVSLLEIVEEIGKQTLLGHVRTL